jgi:alkanesulfonate monooxygenase SsuD/methylene tetrahydromethanopterin reductase-like flavin-dependent oxidoreductase (luciferase family)
MRARIGLSVMLLETRREAIIGLATEGDRFGYDGFFMPEAWAYDMTVLLAEAAARTTRITLGTGILGIWNRSAATIAMAAAALHAISGGRFALGLGASTPQLAEGLHDTPFEPPVPRMRRMVTQIRALLRGERIPLAVTTNVRALKLNVPPAPALPIHVAALGDAMTRLAGELADAWMPFLYPWSQLATGVERLREGATRGGHPDRLPEIHPSVPTVVADTDAKARERGVVRLLLSDDRHHLPRLAHATGLRQRRAGGARGQRAEVHGRRPRRGRRITRATDRLRHPARGAAEA